MRISDWSSDVCSSDLCAAAEVPFFFKQWGEHHPSDQHDPATCPWSAKGRDPDAIHRSGARELRPTEALFLLGTDGWVAMCRVGKKAAGAMLDGREHREFDRKSGV